MGRRSGSEGRGSIASFTTHKREGRQTRHRWHKLQSGKTKTEDGWTHSHYNTGNRAKTKIKTNWWADPDKTGEVLKDYCRELSQGGNSWGCRTFCVWIQIHSLFSTLSPPFWREVCVKAGKKKLQSHLTSHIHKYTRTQEIVGLFRSLMEAPHNLHVSSIIYETLYPVKWKIQITVNKKNEKTYLNDIFRNVNTYRGALLRI